MPRKQTHYIYKTTCLITNRFYVGMHSTSNLDDGYMGSGKRLRYSLKKYGKENHTIEILEFLPDRKLLKAKEKDLITEEMLNDPNCMNLQPGGGGGFCNAQHEAKFKKAAATCFGKKIKDDPIFRKNFSNKVSIENRKRHREGLYTIPTFKGLTHTQSTKDKISEANSIHQKGSSNSQYGTKWITNGTINKKIKKDIDLPNGWKFGRT